MKENYSGRRTSGPAAAHVPEVTARDLIAQLVPGADADLLLAALLAERASAADPEPAEGRGERDANPAVRELRRVRVLLALGESARMAQHALNNPLTALMAEAQLLELEPLAPEHRQVVSRLVELARRVAAAVRRLDSASPESGGGGGGAGTHG